MQVILFYHRYARRTYAALAAIVALSTFLYGALLLGAVAHAAGAARAEAAVSTLSTKVGSLEGAFLAHTRALSPERAAALGFVAPHSSVTVYADRPSLVLR